MSALYPKTNCKYATAPSPSYSWGLYHVGTQRVSCWFKTQRQCLIAAHADAHRPGTFGVVRFTHDFAYHPERGFL